MSDTALKLLVDAGVGIISLIVLLRLLPQMLALYDKIDDALKLLEKTVDALKEQDTRNIQALTEAARKQASAIEQHSASLFTITSVLQDVSRESMNLATAIVETYGDTLRQIQTLNDQLHELVKGNKS